MLLLRMFANELLTHTELTLQRGAAERRGAIVCKTLRPKTLLSASFVGETHFYCTYLLYQDGDVCRLLLTGDADCDDYIIQ